MQVIFLKNSVIYLIIFLVGGIGYGAIEIAFRGHTHWSMVLTGGSAFLSLYLIHMSFPNTTIYIKALLGMIVITLLELSVGIIVNIIFSLSVWDYSNLPFNFLGQISLLFSGCWYILSIFAFYLLDNIKPLTDLQKF